MSYEDIKQITENEVGKKFVWILTKWKVHKRSSDRKRIVVAANLEELIIGDPNRSLRSLAQEMSISSTDVSKMVSEVK